jgi:hypothetical protein
MFPLTVFKPDKPMFNLLQPNWPFAIASILVFVTAGGVLSQLSHRKKCRPPVERLAELKRKRLRPASETKSELPPRVETTTPSFHRNENQVDPTQPDPGLPLKCGTSIQAVRKFGPVNEGALGIITGIAKSPSSFWWSRPSYQCTFANDIRYRAYPKQIENCEHGYTLQELEQPHFASIVSRHITFRAQQIFSGPKQLKSL